MGKAAEKIIAGQQHIEVVAEGVYRLRILFVNVYFVQDTQSDAWVLIDAGLKGYEENIFEASEALFGEGANPEAIILTHGHFDHIGALRQLLKVWNVPVYAHSLEIPYLTGKSSYPPPDPSAGGGMMAYMSFIFPKKPINLGDSVRTFPDETIMPAIPGWEIVSTPGHSPGHVSFLRAEDRVLIAGDAVVTVKQESALAVMLQAQKVCGPPRYFTPDWESARNSVQKIAELAPAIIATGHGVPMAGDDMLNQLAYLSQNFEEVAKPSTGRYILEPALADETGVIYLPPQHISSVTKSLLLIGAGVLIASLLAFISKK